MSQTERMIRRINNYPQLTEREATRIVKARAFNDKQNNRMIAAENRTPTAMVVALRKAGILK